MSRRILALIAVLALALAVLTGLAVRRGVLGPRDQTAAVGGPFQLVDQTGRTVDQDVLKGKWSAVFFGYTFCPDACPTTMFSLGQAEKLLGARARDFQTVFISVDPNRDTPRQLASFLSTDAFPKAAMGLTGTPEQVGVAARAYHVYYQAHAQGAAYPVDHSTIIYLMNPRGGLACVIPYNAPPESIVAQIEGANLIPLGELPTRWQELDREKEIFVFCHSGVRSARAAEFLRAAGFPRVANVAGGIDAWSEEVDPNVPRY